jgi:dCMP deaminase
MVELAEFEMLVFDTIKTNTNLEELVTKPELLRACYDFGMRFSDDPSTKLGTLLLNSDGQVICFGANRFPIGVDLLPERLERPTKLQYMEHGERDAIFQAAHRGVALKDAILYSPWYACADCARAIICSGIKRVVGHQSFFDRTPDRWKESIAVGHQMLCEAGVEMVFYDGKIGGVQSLCNQEVWYP